MRYLHHSGRLSVIHIGLGEANLSQAASRTLEKSTQGLSGNRVQLVF